LTPLKCYLSIW